MLAAITNRTNGMIAMKLDHEAAQALFASVIFASKYHEGIRPLAHIVEKSLKGAEATEQRN